MAAPAWAKSVDSVFKQYGVPSHVWLSIALMESGLDPDAVGDGGLSKGLFMFYTQDPDNPSRRGKGYGLSDEQLFNPVFEAQRIAPDMAAAWAQHNPDIFLTWIDTEHPDYVSALARSPIIYVTNARLAAISSGLDEQWDTVANPAPIPTPIGPIPSTRGGREVPNPLDIFKGVLPDWFTPVLKIVGIIIGVALMVIGAKELEAHK